MKYSSLGVVVVVLSAATAFAANTWYVDAVNGVDAAGRGASADNAFLTLQYAHDQAAAGDTVMCAPGNYDQGYGLYSGHNHTNRLCVSKELHFVSTTPKAAHIVGKFDPDTGADGPNALRCVLVTSKGLNTTFDGFTLRNGATEGSADTGTGSPAYGGGLQVLGSRSHDKNANIYKAYLVDCVVSNCVGYWGGAMVGGTAIRCLLRHNIGTSWGQTAATAALWNTVIYDNVSRNTARPTLGNYGLIVNCTIVGSSHLMSRFGMLWNCVFSETDGKEIGYDNSEGLYTTNCIGKADHANPVANPLFGDWRLIEGVVGADQGLMSDLTDQILLPPGTEMTDFYGRPIDTNKQYCTVGAVQELATGYSSGTISVPAGTEVDGVVAPRKVFCRAVGEYPRFFTLRSPTANFVRWNRSPGYGGSQFLYPDYNGNTIVVPPPFANQNCDHTEKTYGHAYWCDPTADAELADGTEAHPYRTIQAAVDAGKAQYDVDGKIFVVNCKPGIYAEGIRVAYEHNNRLVIPDSCPVLIRSTDGAAVTTIKGAADPEAPHQAEYPGCGPNAIRCVAMLGASNGQNAMQGFTFADGHSSYTDHNMDKNADRVGGVWCKSRTATHILDSVFTNCAALRGGASYYGTFRRCRFYDCVSFGGVFRYGTLVSCYVDDSCKLGKGLAGASQNTVIGTQQSTLNVTYPGTSTPSGSNGCWWYCSIWGKAHCANNPYFGTVFTPSWYDVSANGSGGAAQGAVYWADEATYGVRAVYSASPAVRAAQYPERGTPEWNSFVSNICAYADSDLYGRAPTMKNGRLPVGANFAYIPSLHVPANSGITVTGATPDANGIVEVSGENFSVTVAEDGTGTRPCAGFTANGVTNLFPLASPYTITREDVMDADGIDIAGVYLPHWYVNADPEVGDDANSGFTSASPKRTLASVMKLAGLKSGDTVHAAAGVYNEGSMDWETGGTNKFRVAVKGGVTLVADEGAEKTIIVGAPDTTDSANPTYPGFGPNAMHCVYLNANATLRGFTLTGGYTDIYDKNIYSSDWVVPVTGGGLCGNANGRDNAYAYDCIISNNYAYTGGGTRWVNAVNCRIVENHAAADGGNTRECNLWGCYVNRGYQGTGTSSAGSYNITRNAYSTFGPDNWTYDGGTANRALSGASSGIASISNCVVLGTCGGGGAMTNQAYNTVFAKGRNTYPYDAVSCHVVTDGMPGMFDAEGRPLPGCPAVDRGDRDNLPPLMRGIATDVSGTQRVYNGQIDVGALECDWRARYRADVGQRFAVTAATPDVVESVSGTVLVNEGETISAEVSASAAGRKYVLKFRVGDGAEAVVTAGGAETVYSTPGEQEVVFAPTYGTPLAVSVASRAGVVELVECRSNAGTALHFR